MEHNTKYLKIINYTIITIFFTIFSKSVQAQNTFDSINSRAISMGNSVTATKGNEISGFSNPAGLVYVTHRIISFNMLFQNYSVINSYFMNEVEISQLNGSIVLYTKKYRDIWWNQEKKTNHQYTG